MLVASGVESEATWEAAAVLPLVLIGQIETAAGFAGTISRQNGLISEIMVGDPVYRGDVIETAAGGWIGIRFVDGSVVQLSDGACAEFCGFIDEADPSPSSAQLVLTKGKFAVIAGPPAKADSLTIDTPFGSIRNRAPGCGVGMLSLTALVFSAIKEAEAADPDVTLLNDDSITYKDLQHGVFELTTKEAIPRHIIVEDPGETVVLSRRGSSVSVSQIANSASRMDELQIAQQDVLANFTRGFEPHGSGTPPFVKSPGLLQPINFTESADPAVQKSLEPVPVFIFPVPEVLFTAKPPPPPPSLTLPTSPTEVDTLVFDSFAPTSGTFSASSPIANATLTFGISGGTTVNTVLGGVTYDVSETGSFGTLFLNSVTGAYTFVPNSAAINALSAPTTESFTITVSDGALSTSEAFTVTLNGVNDAAVVSGTTAGSVVEAGGVANAAAGIPTTSGTLTDTDVDNPANTFTVVTSPTKSAGAYGSFTMTAAGVWTYTLDNNNSAVQALTVGDTLTDSFTVTTIDGTAQVVTITINGSNDAAIISGNAVGSVVEAGGDSAGTPTVSGTLADTDVDNAFNTFAAVTSLTLSDDGYGAFTMTASGIWTYTLDNNNAVVDALNVGDTLTDTFTVHTIDGTAQVVTISIHGAGDADPNDFDNLALGSAVVSDPPFVFGTPGKDSVAGGGDVPQIIYGGAGDDTLNGTGVVDTIYGGSGNDTIKGNNGDDTIYGGSGNDTINGSNGNDTIIGGFGADNLTGGNGNDRFVYLSVADSRAGRFDTITDFASGSDKIDLTALGALAFVILALSPTSTSVPAHTIAWIYDSAANETIIYVNPTDQTLSIGNSSLLEVHLQGIASIDSTDFIIDSPTTSVVLATDSTAAMLQTDATLAIAASDLSATSTTADGTPLADPNWSADTTSVSYSVDTARDQVDSVEGARLISSDDSVLAATEDAADSAVIILADGKSIGTQHPGMTLTESHLAFDPSPALNHGSSGNAVGRADVIDTIFSAIAALNAEPSAAHGVKGVDRGVPSHGNGDGAAESGANPSVASDTEDHGSPKKADNPGHADTVVSPGVLNAPGDSGNHYGSGGVGKSDFAAEHDNSVHDAGPTITSHIPPGWEGAQHGLDASFHFTSVSSIDPDVVAHGNTDLPASIAHHEDGIAVFADDGTQAIESAELQSFGISDSHAKGIGHVAHDLIL